MQCCSPQLPRRSLGGTIALHTNRHEDLEASETAGPYVWGSAGTYCQDDGGETSSRGLARPLLATITYNRHRRCTCGCQPGEKILLQRSGDQRVDTGSEYYHS